MNISRRVFVRRSAGAAASMIAATELIAGPQEANRESSKGWIDAHVHVWSPDTSTYPLSPRFNESDMRPKSFTDEELFAQCKPSGVQRIVLIQMSFYEFDHKYMVEVMKKHPGTFSGVALIDFRASDLSDRIDELAAQGMRGFRLHSRGDAKQWVDDPGMHALWTKAADKKLAVCPLINPEDIPYVDALCARFPETTVVVDHFARVGLSGTIENEPLDQLCRLARFPNTNVKTSAFYALGRKAAPYEDLIPMIKRVVDSFGAERLMWASDCPFQVVGGHRYEPSIALIRDRIDFLSDADKQAMLHDTAERVFFG